MPSTIDKHLLDGHTDVQLTLRAPDSDPAVIAAEAANTPFPDGKLALGSINLSANVADTIRFSAVDGKGTVAFNASAKGFFEAGIYPDPAVLLKDFSPEKDIAGGLSIQPHPGSRFLLLHAGYDAGATVKGSMALGVGASVNFGGSGSRTASYGVIHQFHDTDGARDVLAGTIKSWILPNQFDGLDRFAPGTWVITELDGSVALNLGVQAGYDYSWIRQMPDGVLKGDLGLKIQLAANAALGFSASGTFVLALARETDAPVIRLRLFKLARNGWNFALNASAGEQVVLPDIFRSENNINDLISAVFGVHIAQLVKDLTDPTIATPANVAKFLEQLGMKQFVDATGIDPNNLIAVGQAKVDDLIKDWTDLPHIAATKLAALLSANTDMAKLTGFLQEIQGLDQAGVQALLKKELAQVDFFQSPIGQWVESTVPTTGLSAILGSNDWRVVQDLSGKALSILNGQALQMLIEFARKNLGLDAIKNIQQQIDGFNLDKWLQAKLAVFLGKNPTAKLVLDDVQKVQTVLKSLMDNGEKFYDLARKAVSKKYEIDFTATYQKSSTSTALLDVTFDFAANSNLLPVLQKAIDGDFQQLLIQPMPGVTMNAATLTHDINRQSHTDLTMPFLDLSHDNIADSFASVSPVEDHGRVLLYTLNATDETKDHQGFFHASSATDSKLALTASVPVSTGIVRFSPPSVSFGYTLSKAAAGMAARQLLQDLQPLVAVYMPGLFGDGQSSLQAWVDAVDAAVDPNRNGILGETLLTFDVSVSPNAFDPWFNTSADDKDPMYFSLSLAIQKELRQWIPFSFFSSPASYSGNDIADSVLAYSALPVSNGFDPTNGVVGKPNHRIYIDLDPNMDAVVALVKTKDFSDSLSNRMQDAADVLRSLPHFKDALQEYVLNQTNVTRIVEAALRNKAVPFTLGSLLFFEFELISAIVKAAVQLAKFRTAAGNKPADAIKQLSSFGDTFVNTFNNRMGGSGVISKSLLRPLGSALFIEAGRALAQNDVAAAKTAGLFRLTIIESTPPVKVEDLLTGKFDASKVKILLRETLVSGS